MDEKNKARNISVILSGGTGERFGGELPKQYQKLSGKEVIYYAVKALNLSKPDKIIIAASPEHMERLRNAYNVECVKAGQTHNESVKNALDYIALNYKNCDKVLFADSVRPFIEPNMINEYFDLLDFHDGVITAAAITDSLGKEGEDFVDRHEYYLIQKPEAFKFNMLYSCFDGNSKTTAIVQQLPKNADVFKHFITNNNMKITYPGDLALAEYLMGFSPEY
jgi:2-C-methyl-D-erythritol 4-phosphate cytidylyltransferase